MIEAAGEALNSALGLDAVRLSFGQMGLRAAIIYIAALTMIRLGGDRRFIGRHAALDTILSIMLGATLSRAINGSAPFFATLGAALVLVFLHWLFSLLGFYSQRFDRWIKGSSHILIRDGCLHKQALRSSHITQRDIESALRLNGKLSDLNHVKVAQLETSGDISILTQEKPPQVIEVSVEKGIQTVRIQLE